MVSRVGSFPSSPITGHPLESFASASLPAMTAVMIAGVADHLHSPPVDATSSRSGGMSVVCESLRSRTAARDAVAVYGWRMQMIGDACYITAVMAAATPKRRDSRRVTGDRLDGNEPTRETCGR